MIFKSITYRLIAFNVAALLITAISIILVADYQLTSAIDKSQQEVYLEKLDAICQTLTRSDKRLQKTGLVTAYAKAFQDNVIKELRHSYYQPDVPIYPVIIDDTGKVMMHPVLPAGDTSLRHVLDIKQLREQGSGEFSLTYKNRPKWYIYRQFTPWNWMIAFAVPDDIKYASARKLKQTFIVLMVTIAIVAIGLLILIITRFTKPIIKLTQISSQIAAGNLDQQIDIKGVDEVSVLARSFDNMRHAVKNKIADLNHEIEERKRVEQELQYLRSYQSNIIDSMPSMLIGIDSTMKVTQWNMTAEQVTGIVSADAKDKCLFDLLPDFPIDRQQIQASIKNKEIIRIFKHIRHTAAGDRYENLTVYPLVTADTQGVVIRLDDVSKENKLEEELVQSRKMDAIGQLAGGIAHDFNNMLAGMIGAAQLLQRPQRNLDEKGNSLVNMILAAAKKAADLTSKLLVFGRKTNAIFSPLDIDSVIHDSLSIIKRTLDKKVDISVTRQATMTLVSGDSSTLQNVIINLAINASHAMPDGGKLTISTDNTCLTQSDCDSSPFELEPGDYVKIVVRDTGVGIHPENLSRIFDPFFTTKKQGEGTGLGLAAVYGTIKSHHGAIYVSSEVGKGTKFSIYLPCSKNMIQQEQSKKKVIQGSGLILLVDDEEIIRDTGKDILEDMGYTVLLAENGSEAVELFKKHHTKIDVVVTDMAMPVMNGYDAFLKMKEIDPNCKIIISSGYTKDNNIAQLKEHGLAGFLRKPFTNDKLSQLLANITN